MIRALPQLRRLLAGALAAVALVVGVAGCGADAAPTDSARTEPTAQAAAEPTAAPSPTPFRFSELAPITLDELPAEALDTLGLIMAGGPYPYDRDDITFFNREGLLPPRPTGHYREYTVDTPGLSHRGARRVVAGADGELYYTDDHYDSFREIVG